MRNSVTEIRIEAKSVTRAHWTFDNLLEEDEITPHLQQYPLEVTKLEIEDEQGVRTAVIEKYRGRNTHGATSLIKSPQGSTV